MGIEYRKKAAHFSDVVGVDEAETLLEWLQQNPRGKLNLSGCTHLHAANLQVLMAAKPDISVWPKDADLTVWLKSALNST